MAEQDPILTLILTEIHGAPRQEAGAYFLGALRDGTFSRIHRTARLSQANREWLVVVQVLLAKLGKRSWIYREGSRNVWTLEATWQAINCPLETTPEVLAFARGYFDAEGGLPRRPNDRFYIQLTQKDRSDLDRLRGFLMAADIACGRLHNPSVKVEPDYWRFYVLARSHTDFIQRVRSWHPRKRGLLDRRALLAPDRSEQTETQSGMKAPGLFASMRMRSR